MTSDLIRNGEVLEGPSSGDGQPARNCTEYYYMQDSRTYSGDCLLWWAQGEHGYTTDIDKAHLFTKEEAERQHACRETDIPWPAAKVLSSVRKVVTHSDLCWSKPWEKHVEVEKYLPLRVGEVR